MGMAFPLLLADPVVKQDGRQYLHASDGGMHPLLDGAGLQFERFVQGWTPSLLYAGLPPFLVLEFRNLDGLRVAWLLDARLRRLGDCIEDLDADQVDALSEAVVPVLRRIARDVLMLAIPVLSREAQAFASINQALRRQLVDLAAADALLAPGIVSVADMAETMWPDEAAPPAGEPLSRAHLEAGLSVPFEDRVLAATTDGMLRYPSPIDKRPLRCQGSLYLDDFRIAYRFADISAGLAFYVIASDHRFRAIAVYLPALDLLVVPDAWTRHLLGTYFAPGVQQLLLVHAANEAADLVPYLARGAQRVASVLRGTPGTHLGHQLWNELSGIEHLLDRHPGPLLPEWIVPGPCRAIELWGATDRVFPELRHHVRREFAHGREVRPYLYREGVCAVRLTGECVSEKLRRRLQRLARNDAGYPAARAKAAESHRRSAPVIVLGLRVENRTLVDLGDFMAAAIAMIAQRWPGATVVIDGHNSWDAGSTAGTIQSHGEWLAATPPLLVERCIAAGLRDSAAGLDIVIVDTLGATLQHSLAWTQLCDGFLSIWGASLAKYRWACNKPGLVLTSRANLLGRDDLHIYDAPRTIERPSRLLFVDPDAVEDDAGAPRLVAVSSAENDPHFANFRVDHARVLSQFGVLVETLMDTTNNASGRVTS